MSSSQTHKPNFFITHSWKDKEFSKRLANDLNKHGLAGFFDMYSIKPGDSIPEQIGQGLEQCDVYIPILSENAIKSGWCNWEINTAIHLSQTPGHLGRPRIIPILIDNCADKRPILLCQIAYIDFVNRYDEALCELLNALGVPSTIVPFPQSPAPSRKIELPSQPTRATELPPLPVLPTKDQTKVHSCIISVGMSIVLSLVCVLVGIATLNQPFLLQSRTMVAVISATVNPATSSTPALATVTRLSPSNTPAPSMTLLPTPPPLATPVPTPAGSPPPPASIDKPLCSDPKFVIFTSLANGSEVSGVVTIRGNVLPRGASLSWYSVFYSPGIVRDLFDLTTLMNVPRAIGNQSDNYKYINTVYYTDADPFMTGIANGEIATWDTTQSPPGWTTLRLWTREKDGNFLACEVYVYIKSK